MARKRNQHGSIRVLSRKSGDVFEYRYYRTRADGERVPANFVVGTVEDLNNEAGAWARVRNMRLQSQCFLEQNIETIDLWGTGKGLQQSGTVTRSIRSSNPEGPFNHRNISSLPESAYFATLGNDTYNRHRTD